MRSGHFQKKRVHRRGQRRSWPSDCDVPGADRTPASIFRGCCRVPDENRIPHPVCCPVHSRPEVWKSDPLSVSYRVVVWTDRRTGSLYIFHWIRIPIGLNGIPRCASAGCLEIAPNKSATHKEGQGSSESSMDAELEGSAQFEFCTVMLIEWNSFGTILCAVPALEDHAVSLFQLFDRPIIQWVFDDRSQR